MQPGEKPLAKFIGKNFFDELVTMITGAEGIAMADEKFFSGYFAFYRLPVQRKPDFRREVIENPHVMVAGEVMEFDAAVREFGKFSLEADEAFGDSVFVFKPEIKDIAQDENFSGIGFNVIEPTDNFLFAFQAGGAVGHTKVKIGDEVNFFSVAVHDDNLFQDGVADAKRVHKFKVEHEPDLLFERNVIGLQRLFNVGRFEKGHIHFGYIADEGEADSAIIH